MSASAVAANESGSLGRVSAGGLDTTHGAVLYLEDITVSFDGFKALNRLSLSIDVGELRCVIGPNGAGKTTMMDVITGKTRPDAGSAFFGQTYDLTRMSDAEIAHAGIGRKFQKPTIFENHTVFENLELAMKADKAVRATLFSRLSSEEGDRIAATLALVGLRESSDRVAGLLSHGQKQWLEIGMLLMQEPKLLLLDEPVAGMSDRETERTAELFVSLAGTHSLDWDEAVKISGADPDFHRRDLWEAIEAGAYPEYELGMQIFDEEQANGFTFDVLDEMGAVIVGDPARCIERVRRYRAAGCDQLLCLMNPYNIPPDKVMRSVELFGEHVIPAFAGSGA